MSKKVLILCHDVVGKKMAGPGIRYQNIATELAKVSSVTLAMYTDGKTQTDGSLTQLSKHDESFKQLFMEHEVIFAQWLSDSMIEYALKAGRVLIFDLYAPVPIEYLASVEFSHKSISSHEDNEFNNIVNMYSRYLRDGEFFTCSNERQRDFWIGYAVANHLIKPSTYTKNDLLKRFSIAPMGISSKPPKVKELKLRSALGLANDDFILLWTGGIWDWFDAQLVIRSMLKVKDSKIKLVFLGTKHPNDAYKEEMSESIAARKLAADLKLVDKRVIFMDGWVPYDERAAYFLDADAAIYADKDSLETRFSHRTRVLDHIWSELPTICPRGDIFSETIENEGFGVIVPVRQEEAFAAAIELLANDRQLYAKIKRNLNQRKHSYTWENTLSPLVKYINELDVSVVSKRIKKSASSLRSKKKNITHRTKVAVKVLLGRI